MGLGKDLQEEFEKLTRGREYGEVELFTKLQDSFIELSCKAVGYNISLIHGNRSMVKFPISNLWMNGVKVGEIRQCELSDMLFIIYDAMKTECRMFFMQNKSSKRSKKERFKANLIQLDLLSSGSEFCDLNSRKKCTVLKNAEVKSIATYGVFYKKGISYNMKYYSADLLQPVSAKGNGKERVVKFNGMLNRIRQSIHKKIEDYEGTENLEKFGTAIEELRIGEPIGRKTIIKLKRQFNNIPTELLKLDFSEMDYEQGDEDNFTVSTNTVCFIQVNTLKE